MVGGIWGIYIHAYIFVGIGSIGIMEKTLETAIICWGYIGFRV